MNVRMHHCIIVYEYMLMCTLHMLWYDMLGHTTVACRQPCRFVRGDFENNACGPMQCINRTAGHRICTRLPTRSGCKLIILPRASCLEPPSFSACVSHTVLEPRTLWSKACGTQSRSVRQMLGSILRISPCLAAVGEKMSSLQVSGTGAFTA